MNIKRSASKSRYGYLLLAPFLLVPGASGCMFLHAPPTDTVPPPVNEPVGWVFDPKDGNVSGTPLNDSKNPKMPDEFTIPADKVQSADIFSIVPRKGGKDMPGVTEVHLAGVIAPKKGQPGWLEANAAFINWMRGKTVDVETDPIFPTDEDGRRMVAIKFKADPKGELKGAPLLLNRMLVRAGYAVVDLYSPTSFNSKVWLSDESYARIKPFGLWKQPDTFTILQQRVPANQALAAKNKLKVVVGSGPGPGKLPAPAGAAPVVSPGVPSKGMAAKGGPAKGGHSKGTTAAGVLPAKSPDSKAKEKATPGKPA